MGISTAWLLDLGGSLQAAIGHRELLQIVELPEVFEIPCAPPYCRELIEWQQHLVPVMDVSLRIAAMACPRKLLVLIGYLDGRTGQVGVGAITLASAPRKITVDDRDALASTECPAWQGFAISGFALDGRSVPVLHLSSLFGLNQGAGIGIAGDAVPNVAARPTASQAAVFLHV
jgi:chemotaxis signal transduction protein